MVKKLHSQQESEQSFDYWVSQLRLSALSLVYFYSKQFICNFCTGYSSSAGQILVDFFAQLRFNFSFHFHFYSQLLFNLPSHSSIEIENLNKSCNWVVTTPLPLALPSLSLSLSLSPSLTVSAIIQFSVQGKNEIEALSLKFNCISKIATLPTPRTHTHTPPPTHTHMLVWCVGTTKPPANQLEVSFSIQRPFHGKLIVSI